MNRLAPHTDTCTATPRRGAPGANAGTPLISQQNFEALSGNAPTYLGNTETTLHRDECAGHVAKSTGVYRAMRTLWRYAESKALRECHRAPNPGAAEVGVTSKGAHVGLCSSHSRLSPLASRKIFRDESLDLQAAVLAWVRDDRRHDVGLGTFTIPHRSFDGLSWLNESLQAAWNKFVSGAYRKIAKRYGIVGWRWSLEVTHSLKNGWHPHRHVIFLFLKRLSRDARAALSAELHAAWAAVVMQVMGRSISAEHGVDLRTASSDGARGLAAYITKGMAVEASGGMNKAGRAGSRSPHEILADIDAYDRARDIAIFHEMEGALRGARWHGAARAFWDEIKALNWEDIRAELAGEAGLSTEHVLVALTRGAWRKISADVERRAELVALIRSTEQDGLTVQYRAVAELLDSWGLDYRRVMVPIDDYEYTPVSAATSRALAAEAHAVAPWGDYPVPGGAVAVAA